MSEKKIIFIFIFFYLLIIRVDFASAESIALKSFSAQTTNEKLPQSASLKIGDSVYPLTSDSIKGFMNEDETLVYNRNYKSEIENTRYCAFKKSIICSLLFSNKKELNIQKISRIYLDTDIVSQFITDLARQADRDPENATFQADNGKISVFSLSKNGLRLNKEKSLQILLDYFQGNNTDETISLAYDVVKPEISTDSIDNLGITSLIGEGTSNFAGSPKNRIFNIKVAISRFHGALIKPGEEFSFVKTLGAVDGEHGYLPELVIKKDKTEPDFGGGICQVSSTVFRAAIYSGLKITARTPHAYPVSYYNPQGMDATVYIPRPDLKFINNTSGHILIQAKIVGTVLTFYFYGTDDGRKTVIDGPRITEKNPDGSMKTTFTQEVLDKNGVSVIKDVFNSAYDSPSKYPHLEQLLTAKPANWSTKEWKKYKKKNNL